MHLQITNISADAHDAYRFSLGSAGALELITNTQGLPHHRLAIFVSRAQACMPLGLMYHRGDG